MLLACSYIGIKYIKEMVEFFTSHLLGKEEGWEGTKAICNIGWILSDNEYFISPSSPVHNIQFKI